MCIPNESHEIIFCWLCTIRGKWIEAIVWTPTSISDFDVHSTNELRKWKTKQPFYMVKVLWACTCVNCRSWPNPSCGVKKTCWQPIDLSSNRRIGWPGATGTVSVVAQHLYFLTEIFGAGGRDTHPTVTRGSCCLSRHIACMILTRSKSCCGLLIKDVQAFGGTSSLMQSRISFLNARDEDLD